MAEQQATFSRVRGYTDHVREVVEILSVEEGGSLSGREPLFAAKRAEFESLADDSIYHSMAKMMASFEAGLFAGIELTAYPYDNLDIERWFRGPKSHERRIHGHKHAGIRIVREGATLIPALDAHAQHSDVFSEQELTRFVGATAPASQLASQERHKIMKKSRSKKNESFS